MLLLLLTRHAVGSLFISIYPTRRIKVNIRLGLEYQRINLVYSSMFPAKLEAWVENDGLPGDRIPFPSRPEWHCLVWALPMWHEDRLMRWRNYVHLSIRSRTPTILWYFQLSLKRVVRSRSRSAGHERPSSLSWRHIHCRNYDKSLLTWGCSHNPQPYAVCALPQYVFQSYCRSHVILLLWNHFRHAKMHILSMWKYVCRITVRDPGWHRWPKSRRYVSLFLSNGCLS